MFVAVNRLHTTTPLAGRTGGGEQKVSIKVSSRLWPCMCWWRWWCSSVMGESVGTRFKSQRQWRSRANSGIGQRRAIAPTESDRRPRHAPPSAGGRDRGRRPLRLHQSSSLVGLIERFSLGKKPSCLAAASTCEEAIGALRVNVGVMMKLECVSGTARRRSGRK